VEHLDLVEVDVRQPDPREFGDFRVADGPGEVHAEPLRGQETPKLWPSGETSQRRPMSEASWRGPGRHYARAPSGSATVGRSIPFFVSQRTKCKCDW
jgi:hypothetical protein